MRLLALGKFRFMPEPKAQARKARSRREDCLPDADKLRGGGSKREDDAPRCKAS